MMTDGGLIMEYSEANVWAQAAICQKILRAALRFAGMATGLA